MIQIATFPADLTKWNPDDNPFYLEVFGETEPVLDMTCAEVAPPSGVNAQAVQSSPIYEYWWTLGHGGHRPEHRHLFGERENAELWKKLDDIAARIYLYFPVSGGWRAKELVATVKYLSPVSDQKDWSTKAADDWQKLQPILAGASQLTSDFSVMPGIAPALSALSKLQIGNVPQVKGFNWYVEKVTFPPADKHGVMQGVMWALPKRMFELLGGRLTGSLALSFIPSQLQSDQAKEWVPEALPMLAHAAIYFDGGERWAPGKNEFVELKLMPTEKAAT